MFYYNFTQMFVTVLIKRGLIIDTNLQLTESLCQMSLRTSFNILILLQLRSVAHSNSEYKDLYQKSDSITNGKYFEKMSDCSQGRHLCVHKIKKSRNKSIFKINKKSTLVPCCTYNTHSSD